MKFLIGNIADCILIWVILSPETQKEIAIFSLIAYFSITLDLVANTLIKISMNLGLNSWFDSMQPWGNILSCVSGILLWNFISPETVLGAILFLGVWVGLQLVLGEQIVKWVGIK